MAASAISIKSAAARLGMTEADLLLHADEGLIQFVHVVRRSVHGTTNEHGTRGFYRSYLGADGLVADEWLIDSRLRIVVPAHCVHDLAQGNGLWFHGGTIHGDTAACALVTFQPHAITIDDCMVPAEEIGRMMASAAASSPISMMRKCKPQRRAREPGTFVRECVDELKAKLGREPTFGDVWSHARSGDAHRARADKDDRNGIWLDGSEPFTKTGLREAYKRIYKEPDRPVSGH